ncbi:MAG: hypothetical protein Fur0027_14560 [Raineya sp.]
MKALYKHIAQKLQADLGCFVDIWNRQPERQSESHPLFLPAVFVGFKEASVQRSKNGVQNLLVNITLYVVQELYSDTYEQAESQSKALESFGFLERVYVALQDFGGENFSPLQRKSTRFDDNYSNVIVFEIDFETLYQDTSKKDADDRILIEPNLEPQRI